MPMARPSATSSASTPMMMLVRLVELSSVAKRLSAWVRSRSACVMYRSIAVITLSAAASA